MGKEGERVEEREEGRKVRGSEEEERGRKKKGGGE